ncbi:hypothetical protein NEUTE2DRAFT_73100 [Neurospora tetrasperma FGSC 2509]|nr:hypothetical protein NEUTE2DRAFT_73100 [Neurospora tetrasperma FGSC 2509]
MKPNIIKNIASDLAHSDTREREREREICVDFAPEKVFNDTTSNDKTTTTTKTFLVRIRAPAGCLAVVARTGSYRDELGHHGPVNMRPRQALHATIVPYHGGSTEA